MIVYRLPKILGQDSYKIFCRIWFLFGAPVLVLRISTYVVIVLLKRITYNQAIYTGVWEKFIFLVLDVIFWKYHLIVNANYFPVVIVSIIFDHFCQFLSCNVLLLMYSCKKSSIPWFPFDNGCTKLANQLGVILSWNLRKFCPIFLIYQDNLDIDIFDVFWEN